MTPVKKLQVFISSTYIDLKDERQAAVQAILEAGHIPAGMELFAAGDQSQMEVIKDWINQSDVFLLILGSCYGSIEEKSSKSYVQLEYEYALEKNKPLFAIVLDDEEVENRIKKLGSIAIEKENPAKYIEFKKYVKSKRIVKFWKDYKDIKLAVFETLNNFSKRAHLIGWVPGDQQINTSKMTEELMRLGKDNSMLRDKIKQQNNEVTQLAEEKSKLENYTKTIAYKNLNPKSRGFTQKAVIDGREITFQTSEYGNGTLGEIFVNMAKSTQTESGLLECFAMAVSLGLQYGVPLEEFVDKFIYTKFEPSGFVEHPNVKSTTSIADLVFRLLGYEYLGRTDLVHVLDKPEVLNFGADDWDDVPSGLEYAEKRELSSVRIIPSKPQEDNLSDS